MPALRDEDNLLSPIWEAAEQLLDREDLMGPTLNLEHFAESPREGPASTPLPTSPLTDDESSYAPSSHKEDRGRDQGRSSYDLKYAEPLARHVNKSHLKPREGFDNSSSTSVQDARESRRRLEASTSRLANLAGLGPMSATSTDYSANTIPSLNGSIDSGHSLASATATNTVASSKRTPQAVVRLSSLSIQSREDKSRGRTSASALHGRGRALRRSFSRSLSRSPSPDSAPSRSPSRSSPPAGRGRELGSHRRKHEESKYSDSEGEGEGREETKGGEEESDYTTHNRKSDRSQGMPRHLGNHSGRGMGLVSQPPEPARSSSGRRCQNIAKVAPRRRPTMRIQSGMRSRSPSRSPSPTPSHEEEAMLEWLGHADTPSPKSRSRGQDRHLPRTRTMSPDSSSPPISPPRVNGRLVPPPTYRCLTMRDESKDQDTEPEDGEHGHDEDEMSGSQEAQRRRQRQEREQARGPTHEPERRRGDQKLDALPTSEAARLSSIKRERKTKAAQRNAQRAERAEKRREAEGHCEQAEASLKAVERQSERTQRRRAMEGSYQQAKAAISKASGAIASTEPTTEPTTDKANARRERRRTRRARDEGNGSPTRDDVEAAKVPPAALGRLVEVTVGMKVEARYLSGRKYYPGTVMAVTSTDNEGASLSSSSAKPCYTIKYDGGDTILTPYAEDFVEECVQRIRIRCEGEDEPLVLREGMRCEALYKSGSKSHDATIAKVCNSDDGVSCYHVRYDDGDQETWVRRENIFVQPRVLPPQVKSPDRVAAQGGMVYDGGKALTPRKVKIKGFDAAGEGAGGAGDGTKRRSPSDFFGIERTQPAAELVEDEESVSVAEAEEPSWGGDTHVNMNFDANLLTVDTYENSSQDSGEQQGDERGAATDQRSARAALDKVKGAVRFTKSMRKTRRDLNKLFKSKGKGWRGAFAEKGAASKGTSKVATAGEGAGEGASKLELDIPRAPVSSFGESNMSEDEWVSSVTKYLGSPMTPECRKRFLRSMPAEDQSRYSDAVRKRHREVRRRLQTELGPAGEESFGLRGVLMMGTPRSLQTFSPSRQPQGDEPPTTDGDEGEMKEAKVRSKRQRTWSKLSKKMPKALHVAARVFGQTPGSAKVVVDVDAQGR